MAQTRTLLFVLTMLLPSIFFLAGDSVGLGDTSVGFEVVVELLCKVLVTLVGLAAKTAQQGPLFGGGANDDGSDMGLRYPKKLSTIFF